MAPSTELIKRLLINKSTTSGPKPETFSLSLQATDPVGSIEAWMMLQNDINPSNFH